MSSAKCRPFCFSLNVLEYSLRAARGHVTILITFKATYILKIAEKKYKCLNQKAIDPHDDHRKMPTKEYFITI